MWCILIGIWNDETVPIKLMTLGRKRISIIRSGLDYLTGFIKKILEGKIYNEYEFNEVINILSCT